MVVPVDTTVVLEITASDVIHSWWIPKLGGKVDAVPGHINETWFKIPADKAGTTFEGQCAELCGFGHADMRAAVKAVTPDEYEAWARQQRRATSSSPARLLVRAAQDARRGGQPLMEAGTAAGRQLSRPGGRAARAQARAARLARPG